MTAPTPERRVGEAVVRHFLECAEAWDPYACLVGNVTAQACAGIGCDLLDAEKEVALLTAEVERLRGDAVCRTREGYAAGWVDHGGVNGAARAARRYPLPTPAPEARNRIAPAHVDALARYARDEISTGRLAELLGVSLMDLLDLRNAVQSDAPPAPEATE